MPDDEALELETPHGPARAHLRRAAGTGALVLGHGAGGGVQAPDLQAVAAVAGEEGWTVALVEQPYRVAGRRSAAPAPQLDAAWAAVVDGLRERGVLGGGLLVCGGRSSGARVACRTAAACGAGGVLCLAFPLHPPQRDAAAPRKTRLPELDAVAVPVLVIQGATDRFGTPPAAPGREVVTVRGDHALRSDRAAVAAAAREWLKRLAG